MMNKESLLVKKIDGLC